MGGWVTVRVRCYRCGKVDKMQATSWKVGIIAWREKGWKYDRVMKGWLCPDHAKR